MGIQPGQNLGPYRILEPLGKGGMATVYRASQPSLSRQVAIKVLPEFFAQDPAFHERFRQEAMAIAKLRHPNILTVFDSGETDGVAYIVAELVEGGTLASRLGKPLSVDECLTIAKPIASALDYAHSRGMVHRDVKPSNILMGADGTPILSDFGLARMSHGEGDAVTRLTVTGMALGTPEYMAPEQIRGTNVGPPADIYALAAMLYEMLTGSVPHSGDTPIAMMMSRLNDPLPPPRQRNPAIAESVERVLLKGLAKEPLDRYATAGDLVRALETAANAATSAASVAPTMATPVAVRPGSSAAGAQPARKPPMGVIIGVAIAVFSAIVIVTALMNRPRTTGTSPANGPTPTTASTNPIETPAAPSATPLPSPASTPPVEPPAAAANPPTTGAPTIAARAADGLPPHGDLLYSFVNDRAITTRPLPNPDDRITRSGEAMEITTTAAQGLTIPLPLTGIRDFVSVLRYTVPKSRIGLSFRFHLTGQGQGHGVRIPAFLRLSPPAAGAPPVGDRSCCQPFDFFLAPQRPDSKSLLTGPEPMSVPAAPNEKLTIVIASTGPLIVVSAGAQEIARFSDSTFGAGGMSLGLSPWRGETPAVLHIDALDVYEAPGPAGRRATAGAANGSAAASAPPAHGALLYSLGNDLQNLAAMRQQHPEDTVAINGKALDITAGSTTGVYLALPVTGLGDFVAVLRYLAVSGQPQLNFRFHLPSQPGGHNVQIPAGLRLLPPAPGDAPEGAHACCHVFEIYRAPISPGTNALYTGPIIRTAPAANQEEQSVTISVKGPTIVVYVGQRELARAEDDSLGPGRIALQISALGQRPPATVRVTGLEIYAVK